jgi:predicted NUDIX family phosphoesterase
MDKMDQIILAVKEEDVKEITEYALKNNFYKPFKNTEEYEHLLDKALMGRRGDLEEDPTHKQIISYMTFSYEGKTFYYTRGNGSGEKRLLDRLSIGLGGHIETEDVDAPEETIEFSLKREIEEEIGTDKVINIKPRGLIYNENTYVDSLHIGVHFTGELTDDNLVVDEGEMASFGFVSDEEMDEMMTNGKYTPEEWTKIAWEQVESLY